MEEIIKDKIFQYYYKKIYGQRSNYESFKIFPDKDKVSFLIDLYLFISNININNNKLKDNFILSIEKENMNDKIIKNEQNENDLFYEENYNKIINNFNNILNKYNNQSNEKINNEINNLNTNKNNKNEIPNKEENNNNLLNQFNDKNINNNEDNNFEEKTKLKEKKISIKSKKNSTDINIKKPPLKSGSPLAIINSNSNKKENNRSILNKNILKKEKSFSENLYLYKSCPNLNNNRLLNNDESNDTLLNNDLILINQTITEKSRMNLEEFKNDNIVEKLIKCPQNKYISLNCSEANKLALVIIHLIETKNELENKIDDERKKNELRLNKLKLDFDRQKRNMKLNYNKKELNIIETLNQLENEIDIEKKFLDENIKSFIVWDKITIENQRTKEIRENLINKLASLKK